MAAEEKPASIHALYMTIAVPLHKRGDPDTIVTLLKNIACILQLRLRQW